MNDPVKIVDRTFMSGVATAIYAVQTAEAGTAYMSVARSNHGNEKRVVIIVDAGRFRAAWRAATGPAWRGALHRWFGVLFWFLLLGASGAVLYRLVALSAEGETADALPEGTRAGARGS